MDFCLLVLAAGLPEEWRPILVESICDYQPDKWYVADVKPRPPLRSSASKEAQDLQRAICKYALENVKLDPRQRAAVELTLQELGGDTEPR